MVYFQQLSHLGQKIGLLVTNYIIQSYLILNQKIKIVLPQSYIFSIKKIYYPTYFCNNQE